MSNKFEQGNLPPQATDIEEVVLGAIMLEKMAFITACKLLKTTSFYLDTHQKIWQACEMLNNQNLSIDILTITQQIKKNGHLAKSDEVGINPYFITQLTNRIASAANIEHHCMILLQHELKREHIRLGSKLIEDGYNATVDTMITNEMLSKRANELLNIVEQHENKTNSSIIREALKRMEDAKKTKGITGAPCGLSAVDAITGGWQDSDLIILAARPSMGKTALVLKMARNMAIDYNKNTAFFSLEMSDVQLMNRLISGDTDIELNKIQKGLLEPIDIQHLHQKIGALAESTTLKIYDDVYSFHGIKSKCLELHLAGELEAVVIDYLQLIEYPEFKKNREREISEISRGLKLLAKSLGIPFIVLSQLSREVEKRPDKKPRLSDLRDSGSIEQDADIVTFLFRPAYYEMDGAPNNLAILMVAKHRNGALASIKLKFEGALVKFSDWEAEPFNPEKPGGDDLPF